MEFKFRCPFCGNNTVETFADWKDGDDLPKTNCVKCSEGPECVIITPDNENSVVATNPPAEVLAEIAAKQAEIDAEASAVIEKPAE